MRPEPVMDMARPAPSPTAIPSLICLLTLVVGACTPGSPGESHQAAAEDGSWSVSIPRDWLPLDRATLEKASRGRQVVETGWLIEEYPESRKATLLVWRGADAPSFDPTVVPTVAEAQEQSGPGQKVIEVGRRDIGGRPFWRFVTEVHTETDNRTTRQVMYQTWDEGGTYAFQFIAPPDRFDQRLPHFESIAASIRVEGPSARTARNALWIVGIVGVCLLAGAALLVAWLVRRGRNAPPTADSRPTSETAPMQGGDDLGHL